ncbi:MAG: nucleotidyltransferase domain-containing protein [Candidatus Methanodesulfokora sp.]
MRKVLDEIRKIALGLKREDLLAAGLFGSLARGDFDEKSDIDVFVITSRELSLEEQDRLYQEFSRLMEIFGRDVTVLVYDMKSLKKVPSWQTLNLIRDAIFAFDRGNVQEVFREILRKAEEKGIFYDERDRVFRLRKPGRVVLSLDS